MRDPSEFRTRFKAYKEGKMPYENGLPKYEDGRPAYSYTYKNKTSQGKTLNIKDNIVYINGKIAPEGYKWYDGNNGVTYRVTSKGTFQPIRDSNGRDLTTRAGNSHRWLIKGDMNDEFLKDLSEDEVLPIDKLFQGQLSTIDKRLDEEDKYFIPSYLPGVKFAKIKSSPRFKNIEIPYNALDSLQKWTNSKNDFINALGLTGETSFSKFRPATAGLDSSDYNDMEWRPYYSEMHDTRKGFGYFPTDIMNNHAYYNNNAFTNEMSFLISNGTLSGVMPFQNGRNFFPFLTVPASNEANKKIADDLPYLKNPVHFENPVTDALYYLQNNNYGMGADYKKEVKHLGTQLFNDPGLYDWKQTRNMK